MIQINLLPEEYRRKARTPIRLMLAVLAVVTINGTLLAYWTWVAFGVAAEIETERSVAQLEMDGLTPQVNYHNALETESKVYNARERTLNEITKGRVLWTKKLDQLIDVVHMGREEGRHFVWFDDLSVDQRADQRSGTFGTLKASGHSGSAKWDQVANFLDDVENPELSGLIDDFHPPAWPEAQVSSVDEDLIPSEVWDFPLQMSLKGPEERKSAAEARAAALEERTSR